MNNELFDVNELLLDIVVSYSFSQEIIFSNIMRLYNIKQFEIDPCFSKGNFYKKNIPEPIYKYDINPQTKDTIQCDCRKLPHDDNSISSIIFDPPFLIKTGPGSKIKDRFSCLNNLKDLFLFYKNSLKEFYRILKNEGLLIFKCQDFVSSGKQHWNHIKIYNIAVNIGFYGLDFFIYLAKSRILGNCLKNQKHARKYHSYFWIFRKD